MAGAALGDNDEDVVALPISIDVRDQYMVGYVARRHLAEAMLSLIDKLIRRVKVWMLLLDQQPEDS